MVVVIDDCVTIGDAWVVVVTIAMVVVGLGVGVAVVDAATATGAAVLCDGAVVTPLAGSRGTASGKMIAGVGEVGEMMSTVGGTGTSIGSAALGLVGVASAGFVVARGLRVAVAINFGFRVVGGTVGLVVGFGASGGVGMASSDVVGRGNALFGADTALVDGTTKAFGLAAAETTVVEGSVVGETAVDVEDEVEAMGIVGATAAARVLGAATVGVATVEGATDETTATVDGVRATVVSGEFDWLTTRGFGVLLEPSPEANRPPISTHTNAAIAANFRLRERDLGNPSPRQERECNADVPVSEPQNAASRTRSRSAAEGPTS